MEIAHKRPIDVQKAQEPLFEVMTFELSVCFSLDKTTQSRF
jgi:hypothetical protein